MGEEYKAERVTTTTLIWVAILSIVLTVLWDLWIAFLPPIAACTQNVSNLIPTPGVELMGAPFLMFLVTMLLVRIPSLRNHLTTKNLVYLYVTTLVVAYFANINHPWGYPSALIFTRITHPDTSNYIPEFVAPRKEIAELMWLGTHDIGAIPWAILLPEIMWHFLMVAIFGGISIGLVNIFRRQWIDVEMLPFPHVILAHTALMNVESSVKEKWPSKMPFLIGMLFGFLLAIPVSGVTLFPWFPDILMWRTNTCGTGAHQFLPSPDIPWHLAIPKHPPVYALLFLAPTHTLFSVVFYTLIMEIGLFAAYYGFGAYTGITQIGFCGRNWCYPTPYTDPPLYLWPVSTGGMIGFFVMILVLQRDHIIKTLKVAFGRTGVKTEIEKGEPMSYRMSWFIFIASFILMVLFLIFTGLNPWISLVLVFAGIMTWVTMSQMWARVGFMMPPRVLTSGVVRLLVWPTSRRLEMTSLDLTLTPCITQEWVSHQSTTGWGGSFYAMLASYKMARLTGVSPRNVLKVVAIALFTSMFVTQITERAILGVVGGSKFPSPVVKATPIVWGWNSFWNQPARASMSEVAPWVIAGFVFMVVMRYLCSRILWLPDPLMALPAWSWTVGLHGVWFASLVVWIIKSLILKIGGSKLYEEWIVPLIGGFMLGDALEVFIAAIMSYIMFPPTL